MQADPTLEILRENLRVIAERERAVAAQRRICTEDLIRRLCTLYPKESPATVLSHFCELMPEHRDEDVARLCRTLLPERETVATSHTDRAHRVSDTGATIALVHNPYNQAAYQRFADAVIGAKAYPSTSFTNACEDVFDQRCDFCILPIANTQDGRLFSFYAMLDRYELKICAVTEIETDTEAGTASYALVGRHLPDRIPKHAQWYLEGILIEPISPSILQTASLFDALPVRLDTLSVPYNSTDRQLYFTLRIPKGTEAALELYLSHRYERYTLLGLYPELS